MLDNDIIRILEQKDLAVLLIDMQQNFVNKLRAGEADRIIPQQIKVLKYSQKHKIPVFVFELCSWEFGITVIELLNVLERGDNYEILQKEHNNAFYGTNLAEILTKLHICKLFIMGINACFCVHETACTAVNSGFEIITSADVISGQKHHSKDDNIPWFRSNGLCISVDDLILK